jgi:hypothetical protein
LLPLRSAVSVLSASGPASRRWGASGGTRTRCLGAGLPASAAPESGGAAPDTDEAPRDEVAGREEPRVPVEGAPGPLGKGCGRRQGGVPSGRGRSGSAPCSPPARSWKRWIGHGSDVAGGATRIALLRAGGSRRCYRRLYQAAGGARSSHRRRNRPPPYHGGFALREEDGGTALACRISLLLSTFVAGRTPPSMSPGP